MLNKTTSAVRFLASHHHGFFTTTDGEIILVVGILLIVGVAIALSNKIPAVGPKPKNSLLKKLIG